MLCGNDDCVLGDITLREAKHTPLKQGEIITQANLEKHDGSVRQAKVGVESN